MEIVERPKYNISNERSDCLNGEGLVYHVMHKCDNGP